MPLSPAQRAAYERDVCERATGTPLPYLTGEREFFGLSFAVTPDVLIPRPETETLVEIALAWLARRPAQAVIRAVDVGAGSGCITVALAAHRPALPICAVDLSRAALHIARANAARHHVAARVSFVQSDLLSAVDGPLDLIVSNPPYVAAEAWAALPISVQREPRLALLSGAEGLSAIRRLLEQAARRLAPSGLLLIEIGERQANAARTYAQAAFPDASIRIVPDLAGKDRVLEIYANPCEG
jgi:release factor glutamine methyltransferase